MSNIQSVTCAGRTFTADYTKSILQSSGIEKSGLFVSTILVNKKTGKVIVEFRAGNSKHSIFWDIAEVDENFNLTSVSGVDKFGPEYECVMFRAKTCDVYLQNGKKIFDVSVLT